MYVCMYVHIITYVLIHLLGSQRQVQDKTFYLGRLRSKIQELQSETAQMNKNIDLQDQENATYLTYEKK